MPVLIVAGLNDFHTIVSQMFVAMKSEIPEPSPYPFWRSSSRSNTMMLATKSCKIKTVIGSDNTCKYEAGHSNHGSLSLFVPTWMMIRRQIPVPISAGSP